MRFAETNTRRGKGVRACSLLMSILIMCSMLFVGQVGSITASADTIPKGMTVYVKDSTSGTWYVGSQSSVPACVYYWDNNGNTKLVELTHVSGNIYSFTTEFSCTAFKLVRVDKSDSNNTIPGTTWPKGTHYNAVPSGSNAQIEIDIYTNNCVSITGDGTYGLTTYGTLPTPPVVVEANEEMYVDFSNVSGWLNQTPFAYCWDTAGNKYTFKLQQVSGSVYKFTSTVDYNYVIVGTASTVTEGSTWGASSGANQSDDITNPSDNDTHNCIVVQSDNSVTWSTYTYTPATTTGGFYETAQTNFGDTYTNGSDTVNLVPVSATFYDYYSDDEVANGWRSVVTGQKSWEASRTYENSFPFDNINTYISDLTQDTNIDGTWSFPLYFGNFFTGHSLSYSTDARYISFGDEGWNASTTTTNNGTNYSVKLHNFSSQANNSMFMRGGVSDADAWLEGTTGDPINKSYGDASKSFLGLVDPSLQDMTITVEDSDGNLVQKTYINQLSMANNKVAAPYFCDEIVESGLATKITSDFPMRVVEDTKNGYSFEKYVFDSTNGTDNVYFSGYASDEGVSDSNLKINYAYNTKKVKDALDGFDGDQGYGFFPFDEGNTDNTTLAYDFGFGMRLDIQFTVGEDGYVTGTNKNVPSQFKFTGDDDVWVFIDGNLALELGGDHKMASGMIDFAEQKSYIYSGVYMPGVYGSNVYGNPPINEANPIYYDYAKNGLQYQGNETGSDTFTADLSWLLDYTNENSSWSDSDSVHTLTLFYVERGMSESNLSMEFTISPIPNELLVEKDVNVDGVNAVLKTDVSTLAAKDEFDYEVKVNNATNWTNSYVTGSTQDPEYTYSYTDSNGNDTDTEKTLGDDGMVSNIKDGESFKFDNQISDDGTRTVTVTEKNYNGTNTTYTYKSHMKVTDVSDNNVLIDSDVDNVTISPFKTNSTVTGAKTNFKVLNTNIVQVSDLTLSKTLVENDGTTRTDDTEFTFSVELKLPGSNTYNKYKLTSDTKETSAGTVKLKGGESITFSALPIGTKVKITETDIDGYTIQSPTAGTTEITIASGANSVVFTNKKDLTTIKGNATATKTVTGVTGDLPAFSFKIENATDSVSATAPLSEEKTNSTNGAITFSEVEFKTAGTYKYKITEVANKVNGSTGDSTYTYDSNVYWAVFTVTESKSALSCNVKYYEDNNGAPNMNKELSTGVKFVNGQANVELTVKKTSSAAESVNDTVITLVQANDDFSANATGATEVHRTVSNGASGTGSVKFTVQYNTNYFLYESQAPANHELEGVKHQVSIDANGNITVDGTSLGNNVFEYTIENIKSTDLPETGGMGVVVFVVVGVVLIVAAVLLLKPKKDKTNPTDKQQ